IITSVSSSFLLSRSQTVVLTIPNPFYRLPPFTTFTLTVKLNRLVKCYFTAFTRFLYTLFSSHLRHFFTTFKVVVNALKACLCGISSLSPPFNLSSDLLNWDLRLCSWLVGSVLKKACRVCIYT